ncbi:hypothetical protein ACFO5R_20880 [Halosolutus amylolyticus]|uniref:DUF7322 domain-containing protein n=1 Tax=Halosolutus amylolyticus TaxID=2932267 RepID=A0ABD5PV91_9EURY|nr:hypothetical protein [Halosolutus amylolyticus]
MLFDRTEHEPEEYDPEEEFRDPDSDSLTIPDVTREREEPTDESTSVPIPEVSTGETDVPGELLEHFWGLVLVLNAAVLVASLGLLFLLFEGRTTRSLALLAAGAVLSVFAYRRYRVYEASAIGDGQSGTSETGTEGDDGPEPADGAAPDDGPGSDASPESETGTKPGASEADRGDPGSADTTDADDSDDPG